MSRTKLSMLLLIAIVLATIAAAPAVAETIGSSYYAETIAALNPEIHLRLSEPAGRVVGDPLINDGSLGAGLGGTWGVPGYSNTEAISGVAGPRPVDVIKGRPLRGLEDDNTAAEFGQNGTRTRSLNVADYVPEVDKAEVTYSLLFKSEDTAAWSRMIVSHPSNAHRFNLVMNNGMLVLVPGYGTGFHIVEALDRSFNDGQWHHLVAVRNADPLNTKLYVDGEEIELTVREGSLANDFALRIGARGTGTSPFTGVADEIAIWGRALSEEEAVGLFDAATIPEPSSAMLLLVALAAGAIVGTRRGA